MTAPAAAADDEEEGLTSYTVTFPDYYEDGNDGITESKGYLDDVIVTFESGRRVSMAFRDTWNIEHEETGRTPAGAYLALPNLVVLTIVSRRGILEAIAELAKTDYFDRLGR